MQRNNSHTSSLFHYTRRRSSLLSILKNGFRFSYCKEKITSDICLGIPMISFCDIPIGNCLEHKLKYGSYAIGISKKSLIKVGVEPVSYFISENNANAAFYLREKAIEEGRIRKKIEMNKDSIVFQKGDKTLSKNNPSQAERDEIWNDFCAAKNFNKASIFLIGQMKRYSFINRKGKLQINYDENEWRIVLSEEKLKRNEYKWFWSEEEYDSWRKGVNNKFVLDWGLTFEIEDINFILVPKQKDIPNFISKLDSIKQICGQPITMENRYILYSKVVSFEQIENDY